MARRILVTGAGGFLGRHAVRVLRAAGHEILPVHRQGRAESSAEIVLDLLDEGARDRLTSLRPDVVVHLAAQLPGRDDEAGAGAAALANARLDEVAIGLCREVGSRLIYISSSSVYGDAMPPWSELTRPRPLGPYARAKRASEETALATLGGAVVLRVSAPYGPGQRTTTVLRIFVESARAGRPLRYHGTGAREQVFTAAEDFAAAIACAVDRPDAAGLFNVAGARSISMRALAELTIRCVAGCRSAVGPSGEPDPQEGYRAALEIGRARDTLGWSPRIELEEGIARWAAALGEGSP